MQLSYRPRTQRSLGSRILVPAALLAGMGFAAAGLMASTARLYPSSSFPQAYEGPRVAVQVQPGENFYTLTENCPSEFTMNGQTYKPKNPANYWSGDLARESGRLPANVLRAGETVQMPEICQ